MLDETSAAEVAEHATVFSLPDQTQRTPDSPSALKQLGGSRSCVE